MKVTSMTLFHCCYLIHIELVIGFINSPYQAFENDTFATVEFGITSGTIATNHNVSVELILSNQTALSKCVVFEILITLDNTGGSDYQDIRPQVFTFSSSMTSYRFNVSILNDNIFEFSKNLKACLKFMVGETPPRVTLQPAQANINILDDDGQNTIDHSLVEITGPYN